MKVWAWGMMLGWGMITVALAQEAPPPPDLENCLKFKVLPDNNLNKDVTAYQYALLGKWEGTQTTECKKTYSDTTIVNSIDFSGIKAQGQNEIIYGTGEFTAEWQPLASASKCRDLKEDKFIILGKIEVKNTSPDVLQVKSDSSIEIILGNSRHFPGVSLGRAATLASGGDAPDAHCLISVSGVDGFDASASCGKSDCSDAAINPAIVPIPSTGKVAVGVYPLGFNVKAVSWHGDVSGTNISEDISIGSASQKSFERSFRVTAAVTSLNGNTYNCLAAFKVRKGLQVPFVAYDDCAAFVAAREYYLGRGKQSVSYNPANYVEYPNISFSKGVVPFQGVADAYRPRSTKNGVTYLGKPEIDKTGQMIPPRKAKENMYAVCLTDLYVQRGVKRVADCLLQVASQYGQSIPGGRMEAINLVNQYFANPKGDYFFTKVEEEEATVDYRALIQVRLVKTGKLIAYGLLDANELHKPASFLLVDGVQPQDNDLISFTAYVVPQNTNTATFDPATAKDFSIIPFGGDACSSTFNLALPQINDEPLPAQLQNLGLCRAASREMRYKDFVDGKLPALSIWYLSPAFAEEEYPLELKAALINPDKCSSGEASDPAVPCWEITDQSYRQYISDVTSKITTAASECKIYECYDRGCINDGYGPGRCPCACSCSDPACANRCYVYTKINPNCAQTESSTTVTTTSTVESAIEQRIESGIKRECADVMAIRFNGYMQMLLAGLGCANQKADELLGKGAPGKVVASATLDQQGIIPYGYPHGGSDPKNSKGKDGYEDKLWGAWKDKGFNLVNDNHTDSCVPCRVNEGNLVLNNENVTSYPNDPYLNLYPAYHPYFTYARKTMPKSCVKKTNVEIRYFGSQKCGTGTETAEDMCTSSNIAPTTKCNDSNVAASFTVNLCAGSDLGFSSVGASLSPIIIDIAGRGIEISREKERAVWFDMRGQGKKDLVDWPINVQEVAFLVLPDKKGKVTSIRQLFGDFKAKNGFVNLAKLDRNKDGVINDKDPAFKRLRLWFDFNRDGVCDPAAELKTLLPMGVNNISLQHSPIVGDKVAKKERLSSYYDILTGKFKNVKDVYFYVYEHQTKAPAKKRQ